MQEIDADTALMVAFAAGDEEAFVKLYRAYRDRVVSFAQRLLGNPAHAEDAAQDVFIKLYDSRRRYRPSSRVSTFIYRIATNHCLNLLARHEHKRSRPVADVDRYGAAPPEADAAVARGELAQMLRRALRHLPPKQSAALLLCHHEGLSLLEAAAALGVSESAIKSLVHRARTALVAELGPALLTEMTHAV